MQRIDVNDRFLAEVVRHHDELARWLGTEAPAGVLEILRAAHRPEFVLVGTDGARVDQDGLMTALSGARNAVPGLKIAIEQFEVVAQTEELAVVRFVESHSVGSSRRTTAVLVPDEAAPAGLGWLSVHETALQ